MDTRSKEEEIIKDDFWVFKGDVKTDNNEVRNDLSKDSGSGFKPSRLRHLWYKQVEISSNRFTVLQVWSLGPGEDLAREMDFGLSNIHLVDGQNRVWEWFCQIVQIS